MKHLKKDNRKTKKRTFRIPMRGGNSPSVQSFIAAGADVNRIDEWGRTPLFVASSDGNLEVVRALIAAGADVNKRSKDGETPLYWASDKGHLEVVTALLSAGADVNKKNKYDQTPLSRAAFRGNIKIVNLLLRAAIKQGYTREDAKKDNLVKIFDKIQQEKEMVGVVTTLAKTKLPSGISKEIGDFLGGKRKSKKSKAKKHSNKRVTKKQRGAIKIKT